jgi:hypothetical protein
MEKIVIDVMADCASDRALGVLLHFTTTKDAM